MVVSTAVGQTQKNLSVADVDELDEAIIRLIEDRLDGGVKIAQGSWKLEFHTTSVDEFKKTDPEGYAKVERVLRQMLGDDYVGER